MATSVLFQQILIIFLEIAVGYVAAKCKVISNENSKFLSNLIMTITLPCTMLAATNVSGGSDTVLLMLQGAVLLLALYLVSILVCLVIGKQLHLTPSQKAVFIGTAVMPNSAFVGIPLATAILGEATGMLYVASGTIAYNLVFFTYVVSLFRPDEKLNIKNFLTPANIATLVMVVMLLTGLQFAKPLQSFIGAVGNCTTPLALMIVGVMLAGTPIVEVFRRPILYLISALRCVVFPLVFMLVLWLMPLNRTLCMGITILAACPAGSLAAVLAKQHSLEPELAGQAVVQSTLFIVLTVPAMLSLANVLFG